MLKNKSNCAIIKEIILLFAGGIIALATSIITSSINNRHDEKMQINRNAFLFIKEYNENLLGIIACRRAILDTASELGRSLDIDSKSTKATESLREYSNSFENCYSSLLKMKLISNAINLSTIGVDCALNRISTLNKEIISTREEMVYKNDKINFHRALAHKLLTFPNEWQNCIEKANNEFLEFSKNLLVK